ncbi:YggS family pyridoxal phosphate-dependent enzyme [Myxosarcina sp. GI1]|uniref:YggS family pyridoxal phosphate-dependent enzyme n=1 Tax=Myxosarcina sp. GI1 TaxID=1541065 RepID=UPI00055E2831|nr:YggS family pyridoxal phosphate-dependent enzyme [Myxosarcina sp. GI1]
MIARQISQIEEQIGDRVKLVAITKQVSVERMRQAYQAGVRDFGENRLQEALAKQQQLQDLPDICWHFIGHIQKNKAKKVLENFEWIHSVDSFALAMRLERLAAELSRSPKILLQVKMLPDPDKYGWHIAELLADLARLNECQNLHILGLMTILPLGLSSEQTLDAFQGVREVARDIEKQNWSSLKMQELSMGMSDDYLLAVKAGATMIRLGRGIFGERPN